MSVSLAKVLLRALVEKLRERVDGILRRKANIFTDLEERKFWDWLVEIIWDLDECELIDIDFFFLPIAIAVLWRAQNLR